MTNSFAHLLLTPNDMAAVDTAAAASGMSSIGLMDRAGRAVAASALRHFPGALRFVVLCGPGNNGGDGYVAAAALKEAGTRCVVYSLGDPAQLRGDALEARSRCPLDTQPLDNYVPLPGDVVIDALLGAGLSRNVPDSVAALAYRLAATDIPVLAVDLPSGLCGRRGVALGAALRADRTVTFVARKPGHVLMPGRELCGELEVFDIGIPRRIVLSKAGSLAENAPSIWSSAVPSPLSDSHKYTRGHLVVFSGPADKTGAARLSATAGLKRGAGLVTVASPTDALPVNAASLTAIMLHAIDDVADLAEWLGSAKLSAFVLGPGFGVGKKAREFVVALKGKRLVLDADGVSSFKDDPDTLFSAFSEGETRLVLTPHEGEFARLFPDLAEGKELSKPEKALKASARANAVIVYKGADTVIASPDGRVLINTNAPPWLATAGSGDVLAGMIGALLAQGMPAFEAAAAGVYLHGEAANSLTPDMTAEDLAKRAGIMPNREP
ncbi:NAD(P)H-hydrate dehydratase [Rhizobium sp. CFBP 8752]|uniref:NAD(P)H-hydrate dehydratase n=1 Tax=Rhizobium sp. CFBP 8752 TaxID=2775301 RepID=UPI00177EDB8C|nr:NAD(P)H-hydrate dehydratase [Rhizobium sp. CFBP 8752]MBD8663082.1 NAD(P)H-hydrate dehydratase [Rhizobium sp. CFBP 8752]